MAHGKSVENWKWYVKSEDTGASVSGPHASKEQAEAMLARMDGQYGKLKVELVNIVRLEPHVIPLKQEVVDGKRVPARKG
jgi:hypothetical protein